MSHSTGEMSKAIGLPVLAFAMLFAGLGTSALGQALYASQASGGNNDSSEDSSNDSESSEGGALKKIEVAQAVAASFYLVGAVVLLILSIRLFLWKRKWVVPTSTSTVAASKARL
jgi:hypothetical protein